MEGVDGVLGGTTGEKNTQGREIRKKEQGDKEDHMTRAEAKKWMF